jgi:hypothetical protein
MKKKKTKARKKQSHISLPRKYEHLIFVLLLIASFVVFFHEALLQKKVFIATDNIASQSYGPYVEEVTKEGEFPLWIPYIFGGMPGFATLAFGAERTYDITYLIFQWTMQTFRAILGGSDVFRVVFYHLLLALSLYAFIYYKTRNAAVSFFASVSFSFGMAVIIWIMAAHNIKALSFAVFPMVLLFAEEFRVRIKAWHILALVLILHIGFAASHIQMLFYVFFGLGIYYLFNLIRSLTAKEPIFPLLRSGFLIATCAVFAFLMMSDRYFATWEYNKYSIRGVGPISETATTAARSDGGLDYDYATGWSFSPQEISTFLVPSFYGFGNQTYRGPLTNNQSVLVNTYFGQMPFTEQPMYMGILLFVFGIVGMVMYRKDRFVQYLIVLAAISLLISFGRNFPVAYDLMYHYFPFFDKFRVPSMILILLHTSLAISAAYAVAGLLGNNGGNRTYTTLLWLKRGLVIAGALFLISIVGRGAFESAYIGLIQSSGKQVPQQLYSWIYDKMMNDLSFNLGVLLAAMGLFWAARTKGIAPLLIVAALTFVSLADLWRIAYRPMHYQDRTAWEQVYRPGDAVRFIQEQNEIEPFRVTRIEQNRPLTDNRLAYHLLQDIHGYHPAKLRVYQDMMDVAGITNPAVWNILNVKYVISDRMYEQDFLRPVFDGEQKVMENINRMPRAWFAGSVEHSEPLNILQSIGAGAFDPRSVAYVESPLEVQIDPPGETSGAEIVHYSPHRIGLSVRSEGTQFLVVSETYYPAGWTARLNGNVIPIVKANYFQRGFVVPPGEHTLEMTFTSHTYETGRLIVLLTNIGIILFGIVLIGTYVYRRKATEITPQS